MNEEQVKKHFAGRLTELRKSSGMTRLQLAESLGCGESSISEWETGACLPDPYTLLKISKLFSVSVDSLIDSDFKYGKMTEDRETSVSDFPKRVFIPIISALGAYFVASLIFFVMKNIPFLHAYAPFVFMLATVAAFIVLTVFSAIWWRGVHQCVCVSGIIWSVGLCIALPAGVENFKYILVPCAILQFICVLVYLFVYFLNKNKRNAK